MYVASVVVVYRSGVLRTFRASTCSISEYKRGTLADLAYVVKDMTVNDPWRIKHMSGHKGPPTVEIAFNSTFDR